MMPSLRSHLFRFSYGQRDDRLHEFYIPALERSVRYDRSAGFFSSAALAIAAAGIVRLIANGGRMRLLCGAQLTKDDVDAIRRGDDLKDRVGAAMQGCLGDPKDSSLRARLEALAWMVANDRLVIRVVLPRGKDGHPLAAADAHDYYHPKEGVFADDQGNRLGFSGSSNESIQGWQNNYETFMTHASWERQEGGDTVGPGGPYLRVIEERFEELWEGKNDSWIAMEIPEAARRRLLEFRPANMSERDALEVVEEDVPLIPVQPPGDAAAAQRERLVFRFLREAPFLPSADRIGIDTSTIKPWPHQLRVVRECTARYPENFLFCDEVGLGKTIEAGLAVRQLVISGKVKRALILVPRSVLKQWQEELYEKFVLNVPRYEDGGVFDVFDRAIQVSGTTPWKACPLLLASSQLAKRRDRQAEVIEGGPWDLIIVDEAHHARRKDFLSGQYRPNRLLELLTGSDGRPGLRSQTQCLYLLTATPMQVDPVEVWDLLRVLGMGGRWGAREDNFLGFFQELRKPFENRDWPFLIGMVNDYRRAGGRWDDNFCKHAEDKLGLVEWERVKAVFDTPGAAAHVLRLDTGSRAYLEEMVKRHTPLRSFLWRNTRRLLRQYREKGLLKENVPDRDPRNEWIPLNPADERQLYERIEEYITAHYQKYEAERKGLGFVMTVYRRRLTSSFFAIRKSLERRRDFLRGMAIANGGFTEDDLEQAELDFDVDESVTPDDLKPFLGELAYIDDFLHDLGMLTTDSKLEQLRSDLVSIFKQRETVIVFTQYTDTMDYLRDQLRQVYGDQVACYSGRGGEVWDQVTWVPRSKEFIKDKFRQGDEIKILLCTESASEGLNLQTCGVLINFDLPWNPMRVEQRIGRIDRIGQKYPRVWIRNYFYEDTVEALIYRRLGDRIAWFEDVVGELQPILHKVGRAIEQVAMLPAEERARRLDEEVRALRQEIDQKSVDALDLDEYTELEAQAEDIAPPPVTLQQLERAVVGSKALGSKFTPHKEIAGAHALAWNGASETVTFSPEVFDVHPNSVKLLSYGEALLDEVLASAGDPERANHPEGVALITAASPARVSVFVQATARAAEEVRDLGAFLKVVDAPSAEWSPEQIRGAEALARHRVHQAERQHEEIDAHRAQAEQLALVEAARSILTRSALIEIAKSRTPELFEDNLPYGFGAEAVTALQRYGIPYRGLLKLAGQDVPEARATDAYFVEIQEMSRIQLDRRFGALKREGVDVLRRFQAAAVKGASEGPSQQGSPGDLRAAWFVGTAPVRP
jgi:superfamily II DNA or RNA helicase